MLIGNDWDSVIGEEFKKDYYLELREFLKREYASVGVCPGMYDIFNALKNAPFSAVKAVIIGQDPYHGEGQAHGLSFSVRGGIEFPPSLKNIFTELESDLGIAPPASGDLTAWAREGVLLLNTTLTVRLHSPMSHKGRGWELFTDAVIRALNKKQTPVVFLLWGSHAQSKRALIENPLHTALLAPHPSPLSAYRGFFGCRHFSRTNEILASHGVAPINWGAISQPEG